MHFEHDGDTVLKDSDDYKNCEEVVERRELLLKETIFKFELMDSNHNYDMISARRIMKNKFNFNIRQVQTPVLYLREKGVSTERPQLQNFNFTVTFHWIYGLYYDYWKKNVKEEEVVSKRPIARDPFDRPEIVKTVKEAPAPSIYQSSFRKCLKIMERMIAQNEELEKYHDYQNMYTEFWYEKHEYYGTLHQFKDKHIQPLWRFVFSPNKKKSVTCICWNKKYDDMFIVAYGSYEFGKKKQQGSLCLFSLKNAHYPENIIYTQDAVMACDFHPRYPALIAVGLYDGIVEVYDIRDKERKPMYKSSVRTQKHTDPVWQVVWSPNISKEQNFYSISSDGRVMNWIMMKDKLEPEEVIKMKLINKKNKFVDEETSLISQASGLCFDFSPFDPYIFLVGTEEGLIHKCSKAYSAQYQETYEGHHLAVYKVRWNPYHKRIFISASADWTIKIWDTNFTSPSMSLDLGLAVVDVIWSPYQSQIFIALSLEKTYIYDLSVDRYDAVAENRPVKSKCTNLSFSWNKPLLLVGDSHGGINSFKLSRELCVPEKVKKIVKKGIVCKEYLDWMQEQYDTLEECIALGKLFDNEQDRCGKED